MYLLLAALIIIGTALMIGLIIGLIIDFTRSQRHTRLLQELQPISDDAEEKSQALFQKLLSPQQRL